MYIKRGMPGRRRRRYSDEFKAKVAEECRRPGVSIASVALAHGLNANLLRKWVAERETPGVVRRNQIKRTPGPNRTHGEGHRVRT